MEVRFRRATNADRATAQRIVDGALREYGLHVVLEAGDIDLTDLEQHYDARGGRFELLETDDGEVAGVVGWRPASADVMELKKLYLTAHARGRGLGRKATAPGA
jgi:GNAT superfamily N-acetyltransferase